MKVTAEDIALAYLGEGIDSLWVEANFHETEDLGEAEFEKLLDEVDRILDTAAQRLDDE